MLSDDLVYGRNLTREEALELVDCDLASLLRVAACRRDGAHGSIVSYSRKVFIPLTKLCRDVCHYCTFAHPPRENERAYLSLDEVLAIARAGHAAGCKEALFTLGDQPELRYRTAADELARLGHGTTLSYLAQAARAVYDQTGLFAHLNPGHLTPSDVAALRAISLSQGLMLESASERLCERGGPHHGSPDKHPRARLASIRGAGESQSGCAAALDRRGHQRLGWRVAGHAGSRQSGGAVAAPGHARARHERGRQAIGRATGDLSGFRPPGGHLGRPGAADLAAASRRRRWVAAHRRMVARSAGRASRASRAQPASRDYRRTPGHFGKGRGRQHARGSRHRAAVSLPRRRVRGGVRGGRRVAAGHQW